MNLKKLYSKLVNPKLYFLWNFG